MSLQSRWWGLTVGTGLFSPNDNFSLWCGKIGGFLVTSVADFVMTSREVFYPCCLSVSSAWDTHLSCHSFSPPCWPDVWPLVMWVKKSAEETHSLRSCWQTVSVTAKGSSQVWHQERLGSYQQQGDVDAFKRQFGTGHKTNCHSSTVLSPATHTECLVLWKRGLKNC